MILSFYIKTIELRKKKKIEWQKRLIDLKTSHQENFEQFTQQIEA